MSYKEIDTIRNEQVWVKITRDKENKSFSFHVGYKDEFKSFKTVTYGVDFMPTIKEAKEHAKDMITVYN